MDFTTSHKRKYFQVLRTEKTLWIPFLAEHTRKGKWEKEVGFNIQTGKGLNLLLFCVFQNHCKQRDFETQSSKEHA